MERQTRTRGEGHVKTGVMCPRNKGPPGAKERPGTDPPLEPVALLHLDVGLPASRTVLKKFHLLQATQFMALGYGGPRKLMRQVRVMGVQVAWERARRAARSSHRDPGLVVEIGRRGIRVTRSFLVG